MASGPSAAGQNRRIMPDTGGSSVKVQTGRRAVNAQWPSMWRQPVETARSRTNSAGRRTSDGIYRGAPTMAVMTFGMSEAGLATRKKCRLCGHQLSLHEGAASPTVQPTVVVNAPAASPPPSRTVPWRQMAGECTGRSARCQLLAPTPSPAAGQRDDLQGCQRHRLV